ncbi:MAG: hypothetical protein MJ090_03280 [Clostridia bacterium]|nr:hypothetical protein [Clostridia bacterium]
MKTDYKSIMLIRTPEREDFTEVKAICEDRFGKGYIKEEEFNRWITDDKYCKVADLGGKVIGIVYLMPDKIKNVARALKLDESYIEDMSGGKNVIRSRCAAIDKDYENMGISDTLHREIFSNISPDDFGAIIAPAWTYNGYTPMAKPLKEYGFELFGERENLWYNMEEYECIICGGRCKCTAAIYIKKL